MRQWSHAQLLWFLPHQKHQNVASTKPAVPSWFLVGPTTIKHFFLLNQTILYMAAGELHPQPHYQTSIIIHKWNDVSLQLGVFFSLLFLCLYGFFKKNSQPRIKKNNEYHFSNKKSNPHDPSPGVSVHKSIIKRLKVGSYGTLHASHDRQGPTFIQQLVAVIQKRQRSFTVQRYRGKVGPSSDAMIRGKMHVFGLRQSNKAITVADMADRCARGLYTGVRPHCFLYECQIERLI